jgi:pimeloyl-ACP methyl ester carboxylesterase
MATPTLIVVGEEDAPCIKPSHFLGETIPEARLETISSGGHSINLEEPAAINYLVGDFRNCGRSEPRLPVTTQARPL